MASGSFNLWLHRCAVLLAVCVFLLIGSGALLTSTIRPLPGTNAGAAGHAPGLEQVHLIFSFVVGALTLVLAVWYRKPAGWIVLAGAIVTGVSGSYVPILHAVLSPILFAGYAAVALFTAGSWSRPAVPVPDLWPPLRRLAVLTPVLVILQTSLGAAFRHNAMGVVWHILNAGIVLLVVMVLGVSLLRQFPDHPSLRPAAIALLTIAGAQVLLGFFVYMVLLIVSQNNQTLVISGVLHVLNGSLTLAASMVLTLQLQRCDAASSHKPVIDL